jgi:hypothetical protein
MILISKNQGQEGLFIERAVEQEKKTGHHLYATQF